MFGHTYFLCTNSPTSAQASSFLRFLDYTQLDTHTHTHFRLDCSILVISPSHKPLRTQRSINTKEQLCPQRDSNTQSHQSRGSCLMPYWDRLCYDTGMIKSKVRWAGYVACMYENRNTAEHFLTTTRAEINGALISVRKHNYNCMIDDGIYWQSKYPQSRDTI